MPFWDVEVLSGLDHLADGPGQEVGNDLSVGHPGLAVALLVDEHVVQRAGLEGVQTIRTPANRAKVVPLALLALHVRDDADHEDVAIMQFRQLEDIVLDVHADELAEEVSPLATEVERHEAAFRVRSRPCAGQQHPVLVLGQDVLEEVRCQRSAGLHISVKPDQPVMALLDGILQGELQGKDLVGKAQQILTVVVSGLLGIELLGCVTNHEVPEVTVLLQTHVVDDIDVDVRVPMLASRLKPAATVKLEPRLRPRRANHHFHVTSPRRCCPCRRHRQACTRAGSGPLRPPRSGARQSGPACGP